MDAASALRAPVEGTRLSWRVTPLALGAGLTLLAVALRLIDLGTRPLWLDEAYSAWFSSRGWSDLWTVVPTYETHPPFYYSLLKLWRDVTGGGAVALRSLSVLIGALTVPVVIAAATELERQAPTGRPLLRAYVAGALAALAPMLLVLDQEARPYPLLIFAYAVALLGLLRLLRELRVGPGSWRSWALLGFGTELTLWAHHLGALYAFCLALALLPVWLRHPWDPSRSIRGVVTAAVVAAVYAPCLMMLLSRAGDWGTGWLGWDPMLLLQLLGLYGVPYEALTIGSAISALIMMLLIKRCIEAAFAGGGWTGERAILLLWFGPPILAAIISALFMPIFLPRTLAASLVPAYLAMSSAVARGPSRQERLFLAAGLSIPLLVTAVQVAMRPPMEHWSAVSAYLRQNVGLRDKVWLYPNDSALPLREAGYTSAQAYGIPGEYPAVDFKGPIRAGSPAVVSLTPDQARKLASDPTLAHVRTIWLLTRQSELFDPGADVPRALAGTRKAGAPQHWGYISVRPYVLR